MSVSEHIGHVQLCDVVTEEGLKLQKSACSDFIIWCEINVESWILHKLILKIQ